MPDHADELPDHVQEKPDADLPEHEMADLDTGQVEGIAAQKPGQEIDGLIT